MEKTQLAATHEKLDVQKRQEAKNLITLRRDAFKIPRTQLLPHYTEQLHNHIYLIITSLGKNNSDNKILEDLDI